jgi:chromosome partitioning protein
VDETLLRSNNAFHLKPHFHPLIDSIMGNARMRRVIFNQKGGVGKSSIAANLAAISAYHGISTLLVDLDPQGNASQYLLGDDVDSIETDTSDLFGDLIKFGSGDRDTIDYVTDTIFPDLFVIASSPDLYELEGKLSAKHKIYKLREALVGLGNDFDAIYIDTPPAFNFFSLSALIAAQGCLIPFDCDEFARRALYQLMENVEETRGDHNNELYVEGIVINQFIARARLPRVLVEELCDEGLPVLGTKLSSSVKMKESHEQAMPLIHLAPRHKLTGEYLMLFKELESA